LRAGTSIVTPPASRSRLKSHLRQDRCIAMMRVTSKPGGCSVMGVPAPSRRAPQPTQTVGARSTALNADAAIATQHGRTTHIRSPALALSLERTCLHHNLPREPFIGSRAAARSAAPPIGPPIPRPRPTCTSPHSSPTLCCQISNMFSVFQKYIARARWQSRPFGGSSRSSARARWHGRPSRGLACTQS